MYRKIKRCFALAARPLAQKFRKRGSREHYFAGVYYSFFSSCFRREQRAVLAGHHSYEVSLSNPVGSATILRRNTHRLEKGILMKPRRIPFGLNYIEETVNAFCKASDEGRISISREEFLWAHDVLVEYFDIHSEVSEVTTFRKVFDSWQIEGDIASASKRVPYLRDIESEVPVSYDSLFELARLRRSVRWFSRRKVEREKLEKALLIAAQSPSACNRQPFRFHFFDDDELIRDVVSIPMGTAGYSQQIPTIAVVVGQQRHYFSERDRHVIYIDASLATMSFLFALESLGLSSCCINWPDVEEKELRLEKLIGLEADERPIMLLAIGYPDPEGMVAYSAKKSPEELSRYNLE